MPNFVLKNIILLFFISIFSSVDAQVASVKFCIKHNADAEEVDMYLVIIDGKTSIPIDRIQFNSQITFVVPKGLKPTVAKTYMPLNSNMKYDGSVPCKWKLMSSILSPAVTPEKDYYAVVPELHPSSFYNDLKGGDTIKLFTLDFKGAGACLHKIRLFDNDNDPKSDADGMQGADFLNTFTIGGTEHIYTGNVTNSSSLKSYVKDGAIIVQAKGKSYQWFRVGDPQILDNTTEPIYRPSKSGNYYVKIISDYCEVTTENINFKK
jgi:hypothetical protein